MCRLLEEQTQYLYIVQRNASLRTTRRTLVRYLYRLCYKTTTIKGPSNRTKLQRNTSNSLQTYKIRRNNTILKQL